MNMLSEEQKKRALEVMQEYLAAPNNPDGVDPRQLHAQRDEKRIELIESALKPLVTAYLKDTIELGSFKSQIDSINKRNEYWGFKGIKGQMFFNMVVNGAADPLELDSELKAALALPADEAAASSRIRNFESFVRRIGQEIVEAGGTQRGKPKLGSVPFFLSYFWQIQDRETWPVYYTNSVEVMRDLNLWQPTENLAQDYLDFKQAHEELMKLFSDASGQKFGLYDVEHVFWFKGGNPYGGDKPLRPEDRLQAPSSVLEVPELGSRLPDSYVPPVVAILPVLARNESCLEEVAKASGTSVPRAFEKSVDAAFTVLGYETQLLGQGQGRVPDGKAIDQDNSYAIIWDAKVRGQSYSMGTDDRTIREYIVTQSRELRRRRGFRNVYYVIVSSKFADDYDDAIRSLKMETDISEVILMDADALVTMVELKLRSPLQVTLGPDGLQRLFTSSAVLTADTVKEMMG